MIDTRIELIARDKKILKTTRPYNQSINIQEYYLVEGWTKMSRIEREMSVFVIVYIYF